MIKCPKCNTELPDGAKFCFNCGSSISLVNICPSCGKELKPNAKFCKYCGTTIATPEPTTEPKPKAVEPVAIPTEPVQLEPEPVKNLCPSCGKELKPNAKFCKYCGMTIATPEPTTEPEPKAVEPAVVIPPEPVQPEPEPVKNICPNCGKELKPNAKFCKYCGMTIATPEPTAEPEPKAVEPAVVIPPEPVNEEPEPMKNLCPNCGKELKPNAKFCKYCGQTLQTATAVGKEVDREPKEAGKSKVKSSSEADTETEVPHKKKHLVLPVILVAILAVAAVGGVYALRHLPLNRNRDKLDSPIMTSDIHTEKVTAVTSAPEKAESERTSAPAESTTILETSATEKTTVSVTTVQTTEATKPTTTTVTTTAPPTTTVTTTTPATTAAVTTTATAESHSNGYPPISDDRNYFKEPYNNISALASLNNSYTVKKVSFRGSIDNVKDNAIDVSSSKDKSVLAWVDGNELIVATDGYIVITTASHLFDGFTNLEEVDFGSCIDTSELWDMGDMFNGCTSLKSVDMSCFNTSKVEYMVNMFSGCSSITSANLSSFDVSKVIDAWGMFKFCTSLKEIKVDKDKFVFSEKCDTDDMFFECRALKNNPLE